MVKSGVIYTCDRCNKSSVYNNDQLAMMDGWNKVDNKDLCDDCFYEYDRIIDNFFNLTKEG